MEYTTQEKSKELLKKGLPKVTKFFYWDTGTGFEIGMRGFIGEKYAVVPAYTVGDLLTHLPVGTTLEKSEEGYIASCQKTGFIKKTLIKTGDTALRALILLV